MRYKAGYKVVRVIEDNLVSALVDRWAFTYYIGLETSRKKDFGPMGVLILREFPCVGCPVWKDPAGKVKTDQATDHNLKLFPCT